MAKIIHLLIVMFAISCSVSMKGTSFQLLKDIAKDVDPIQERMGWGLASCVNTRDNSNANKCDSQIRGGSSCGNYLLWKDCDMTCNLCACSTSKETKPEHCNGHGTCKASCDSKSCTGAKCECQKEWTGHKCQIKK